MEFCVNKGFYEYQAYFLAGVAINEFKTCSLADQIIEQIIKWGFDCFNLEKQEWRTFLKPIAEDVRKVLPRTLRGKVINSLIQVLETTDNDDARSEVAYNLGKIAVGNDLTIRALIRVLETTDNDHTRWKVADSLGKIDPGNEFAIKELIRILETTEITTYDFTCRNSAYSLGEIAVSNELAIKELIRILETTDNDNTRTLIANSLGTIDPGNELAVQALIAILEITDNDDTRSDVARSLEKIAVGNELAIQALIAILESTDNDNTRSDVARSLGTIDPGNEFGIQILISILKTTDNLGYGRITYNLEKIAVGNELAIKELISILETTNNDFTCDDVTYILEKIAVGNKLAIQALIGILETTDNDHIRRCCARNLGTIDPGNELAIQVLIRILETTDNNYTTYEVANTLNEIITTNQHRKILVNKLQPYLNNETYKNNFPLYRESYETLWNIAQNLTYPEFYQAWHNNPSPLNLAQLPQLLQAQIANHNLTETHQIYLIDGSKFIDQDNPSLDIYEQLLDQQCQPRPNGEPENLSQLKSYWGQIRRNSDKQTILIFYENPTLPTPQGFSPKFINILSKFEGAIALIDDNIQSNHIKTFTSQDPNLLQNIIDWVKNINAE